MDQTVNLRSQVVIRSKEEIQQILEEQASSGKSIKLFCEERHINRITFNKWRSRYKDKMEGRELTGGFTRLEVIATADHAAPPLFAELRGIKIYQPVAASYLKELLA